VRRLNDAGQAIFGPGGTPMEEGSVLRNPALAETLRQIARQGPSAMYGGAVGAALADFLEGEGSPLRVGDFARHEANWTEPIRMGFRGRSVHTMPPSSQGTALLQQLAMAETLGLDAHGWNSPDYLHGLVEITKLAFADRDRWLADPDAANVPLERLLSPDYLRDRAGLVTDRAAESVEPGFDGAEAFATRPTEGDGDTVYLMAVDRWGNAVSWIQSLFSSFGSGLVDPATGVVLQNRGGGFTLEPGHPNEVAPGKRPFHTLTPAMVTDADGRFEMTLGTPGGHGQTQTLVQVLHNTLAFGMAPQQAVEAPRYRWEGGVRLLVEDRMTAEVLEDLAGMGHDVRTRSGWTATFGSAQVIWRQPNGVLRTGADVRREGTALAY
jgi:gamma-glutamyltranspeptidase